MTTVLIQKSFRYRVYPTKEQIARIAQWENALRFLWNLALEQRLMGLSRPKDERIFPTAFDQQEELTDLREELPWLADVPRNVCNQLLIELDKAWQRCFLKISKAPQFKRKGKDFLSLTEPHTKYWRLDGSILRFPKLGNLRAVIHRPLEGKPKICTLKRDVDQWFISISCEVEVKDPTPKTEPVIALDRGVVNILADSEGNIVKSPRFFAVAQKKLVRAQRQTSRKKKGSNNQAKAKLRVAKIHRKIRRQREWFIHQLSHKYSKSHGTVVIERLKIKNMTASAHGTLEDPGHNIRQKSGLNRGILDAGWGILAYQLGYKLFWNGGRLVEDDPSFSSQECYACGLIDSRNRPDQATFSCIGCGVIEHADVNAAKVLDKRFKNRGNTSVQPVKGSCRLRTPRRNRKVIENSKAQS
jgi:putative transposase